MSAYLAAVDNDGPLSGVPQQKTRLVIRSFGELVYDAMTSMNSRGTNFPRQVDINISSS